MIKRKISILRIILSVITWLVIGFFGFVCFLEFDFFEDFWELNYLFFIIFNISLLLFFVFWNLYKFKFNFLLLLIIPAAFFIITGVLFGISSYERYTNSIPKMREVIMAGRENYLLSLDERPTFIIKDNFPMLDGATTFYPLYGAFLRTVYQPEKYINFFNGDNRAIYLSRTAGAYDKLLERKADLIFCFEPSSLQREQFNEKGLNLKLVPIGIEAFVFFVNKKNKVNNLTVEDIRGIYSGQIKNWKNAGGSFMSIRPFQRPDSSGSQTIMKTIMGDVPLLTPKGEYVSDIMSKIFVDVASYKNFNNAIGYSFLYFSTEMVENDQIKLLSVNGIFPSRETIQDGTYPFLHNIYAIYIDDENKNPNVEHFIEWILSEQGRKLTLKVGYMPLNLPE